MNYISTACVFDGHDEMYNEESIPYPENFYALTKLLGEYEVKKLGKKYEWIISAQVHFEVQPDPKGKGKICKIELSLPGPRIFASSDEKNYELSVKNTISDLEKQLKKRKEIYKTH